MMYRKNRCLNVSLGGHFGGLNARSACTAAYHWVTFSKSGLIRLCAVCLCVCVCVCALCLCVCVCVCVCALCLCVCVCVKAPWVTQYYHSLSPCLILRRHQCVLHRNLCDLFSDVATLT